MRAYMSRTGEADHGRQCLDCNWFPSGHVGGIKDRAAHAEREARAILAETEPLAGSHQSLTWLGDWAPEFAESLSAFIEQEF